MHKTRGALNPGRSLLVRAEPLTRAEQVCRRMVDVVRVADGALLLDADPDWGGAINTVLVMKGVRVGELIRMSRDVSPLEKE